jgi:hypothetical protein
VIERQREWQRQRQRERGICRKAEREAERQREWQRQSERGIPEKQRDRGSYRGWKGTGKRSESEAVIEVETNGDQRQTTSLERDGLK